MVLHQSVTNTVTKNIFNKLEERVSKLHKNKYDYSKVEYLNMSTKVEIICPIHGSFFQSMNNHLRNNGCNKCGTIDTTEKQKISKIDFIRIANTIHNNIYDYTKLEFKTVSDKGLIICPIHGEFTQRLSSHIHDKRGCRKCAIKNRSEKLTKTTEQFIKEASKVHVNYYDYTNTKYKTSHTNITIICPVHGKFNQRASHHLEGMRCPSCAKMGFDPSKPSILYYISIDNGTAYKIGITNYSVQKRFTGQDFTRIKVLKTWEYPEGKEAFLAERKIIKEFKEYRYKGPALLTKVGITEMFYKDVLLLDTLP